MPFYEYECSACKFYVEALQKISEEPLKKCPSCKKQTMKKLVSAPVFRLKGGGWYETDFKSDKEEKRNLAGSEEAPESKSEQPKADSTQEAASAVGAKTTEVKSDASKPPAGGNASASDGGRGTVGDSETKSKTARAPAKSKASSAARASGKPKPKLPRTRTKAKPATRKKSRR